MAAEGQMTAKGDDGGEGESQAQVHAQCQGDHFRHRCLDERGQARQ